MHESLNQLFFFIFSGAAILATLALFGRQPLIIAYIALGVLIGPYSLQWVTDIETISSISENKLSNEGNFPIINLDSEI